jgi:hypothetical protein
MKWSGKERRKRSSGSQSQLMGIEKEINALQERNARVEADKAWETNWTRRITIAVLTYAIIVLFLIVADIPKPFLAALVPAMGFVPSTLTMPPIKRWWIKSIHKKELT